MQPSTPVREALIAFYERFSAGDVDAFADGLAGAEEVPLVIGTAPDEWIAGRSAWISTYREYVAQMPQVTLVPGDIRAFACGDAGWVADRPRISMPDGEEVPVRVTAVLHRENGDWKVVNAHFSIGVPDERLAQVLSWVST